MSRADRGLERSGHTLSFSCFGVEAKLPLPPAAALPSRRSSGPSQRHPGQGTGQRLRLAAVWSAADVDGSGSLHRREVRQVMAQMGKQLGDEEFDSAMDSIDKDGSGPQPNTLSRTEPSRIECSV